MIKELVIEQLKNINMRKFHLILSYTMLLIGIVHIIFSTQIYDKLSFNSLWFISGGLWGILLGFINLLLNDKTVITKKESIIWFLSNLLSTVFIVTGVYVMRDTGSYVIAIIILVLFITSILLMKTKRPRH